MSINLGLSLIQVIPVKTLHPSLWAKFHSTCNDRFSSPNQSVKGTTRSSNVRREFTYRDLPMLRFRWIDRMRGFPSMKACGVDFHHTRRDRVFTFVVFSIAIEGSKSIQRGSMKKSDVEDYHSFIINEYTVRSIYRWVWYSGISLCPKEPFQVLVSGIARSKPCNLAMPVKYINIGLPMVGFRWIGP